MALIPIAEPSLGEEELNNVLEAVKSGWISSLGKFIPEFEKEFADFHVVKHGVATSNGTTALHLALVASGVGPGDEVIVPTLTFIATANAVKYTGATPVFVDSNPDYWCIDPQGIEKAVTGRTKAIIPVHLYGHPCDMDAIGSIAKRHGLRVIEDAAEAHGARYRGRRVGSFGDISCFSFYGNKVITTGEGGICLTDDPDLAGKMRALRDHAMSAQKRYWHESIGFNYRMTNLQAAVGVAQVKKMARFLAKKRENEEWYRAALKGLAREGIVTLHPEMPWAWNIYWMYSILLGDGVAMTRDDLMLELGKQGIETRPVFYPIHTMPPYYTGKSFPVAENISARGISLPSAVSLTHEQVITVSALIKKLLTGKA